MRYIRKSRNRRGSALGAAAVRTANVSVIIPVLNERKKLPSVLREVMKIGAGKLEIIVVANGSTDGSKQIAESMGARVFSFEEPLGHDVGRSIGAGLANGKILLFLDGDIVIPARDLRRFVHAVHSGVDVALNRYLGPIRTRSVHPVVLAKHALNAALGRTDLRGTSMTTIPHALSRRALAAIGAGELAVPPKAHAMAVQKGLVVRPVHFVSVGRLNPRRKRRWTTHGTDTVGQLIIGDHLEAIRWLTATAGERGNHTDLMRNRNMVR
ncbi:glycosyltransferase family 2 protein [Paenibacillus tyrfis]|uniref:glycosyltransferase family 2 protein n=1 Tax=Paenibacillus tyrfis TaxID=1501230 RepID=UPI0015C5D5DF|nr:glycosyltransferase family 2 protein [Paenibacillus tyrfis]